MDLSTFDSIHFGVNNGEYEWKTKTTMFLDKSLRRKFVILNGISINYAIEGCWAFRATTSLEMKFNACFVAFWIIYRVFYIVGIFMSWIAIGNVIYHDLFHR